MKRNICGQRKKKNMNDKERKDMIEPEYMMMGKEEVDHEHVSLLNLFYPGRQPISKSVG